MIILKSRCFGLTKEEQEEKKRRELEKGQTMAAATVAGVLGVSGLVEGLRTNAKKEKGINCIRS